MDVQVQATILTDQFLDQAEAQRLIRSHGLKVQDLGGGQVQVQGCFMKLRTLKARLDLLVPPGAGSELYAGRGPDEGGPEPPSSSSQTHPAAQDHRTSSEDPQASGEYIIVDSDVFRYAQRLRKNELDSIRTGTGAEMTTREDGESTVISFQGRGSRKLQKLLDDLSQSLRTQDVPLRDVNQRGQVLLERIQQNQNISGSVLVRELEDRLHLVGPSKDSYELKQRLLGKLMDQSEARGWAVALPSRGRSSLVPVSGLKSSGGGAGGAMVSSPSGRAAREDFGQKEDKVLSSPGRTKRFFSSFSLKRTKRVDQSEHRGRTVAPPSRGRSSSLPPPGPRSAGGGAGGAAGSPQSGPASLSESREKRRSEKEDQKKDKICLLL